jgi:hypothetical protein
LNLSENFTLEELIRSDTATRLDIDNTPGEKEIENLTALCTNVLEPLRALLYSKDAVHRLYINSGFRCKKLNTKIGGAVGSQHIFGQAADIHVDGLTTYQLYNYVKKAGIVFDQLIREFAESTTGGWVHVSFSNGNRGQHLIATKVDGKTVYTPDIT